MTTASPSARARYRLPCPVDPSPLFLPAEDLTPGENFAHEHRCPAVGNRVMSRPISAMMTAAATGPIPRIWNPGTGSCSTATASSRHAPPRETSSAPTASPTSSPEPPPRDNRPRRRCGDSCTPSSTTRPAPSKTTPPPCSWSGRPVDSNGSPPDHRPSHPFVAQKKAEHVLGRSVVREILDLDAETHRAAGQGHPVRPVAAPRVVRDPDPGLLDSVAADKTTWGTQ